MLKKFGTANCEAVVQRLAEVDNKKLTRDELKEKFEFVKECKVWIPFINCPNIFYFTLITSHLIYNTISGLFKE